MIGRLSERIALQERLERTQTGVGGLVLVQGEPGIGKSRLLADFVAQIRTREIAAAQGYATAIDRSTPYFAWRQVLAALLEHAPAARIEELLSERLQRDPTLMSWAPLLRDVLPLALNATPLTEQISGAARATSIEALFVALLNSASAPRILVFEDLHWFDEASLHLLRGVQRRVPHLLIVASRRLPEHGRVESVAGFEDAASINLDGLQPEAVAAIIERRLRVQQAPAALADFVRTQTGGNPFYCEELVSALRDAGVIAVERGACTSTRKRWIRRI